MQGETLKTDNCFAIYGTPPTLFGRRRQPSGRWLANKE